MRNKVIRIIILTVILLIVVYILKIKVIMDMLKLLLAAFIIAYALKPIQRKLVNFGVNRKIASILIILTFVLLFLLVFIVLIPNILKEGLNINSSLLGIKLFIERINEKLTNLNNNRVVLLVLNKIYDKITVSLAMTFDNIFDKLIRIGENFLSLVVIPVIVYYFISDSDKIVNKLVTFLPVRNRSMIKKIGKDIDKILGRYIISQFLLCILIAILTFFVLVILKIEYPLLLSVINGFFNIIPYFGPLFGGIPAVIMALLQSPQKAIWALIALYIIQQLEGDIISPKITGDSVSMHPLLVILLLIIGGKVGGFIGMVLAIPIGVIVKVIYEDLNYYFY